MTKRIFTRLVSCLGHWNFDHAQRRRLRRVFDIVSEFGFRASNLKRFHAIRQIQIISDLTLRTMFVLIG